MKQSQRSPAGKLVLIIGPSGVGKSVILQALRDRHPDFVFPRSATTRARRKGEGTDLYRFVSDEEFDRLIEENKVLESAVVHGTERYGTLADEIIPAIDDARVVIREVDVQGFDSIRKHRYFREGGTHPLQSIFILPEKRERLIERIRNRAPISEEELRRRIASMDNELDHAAECDVKIVNHEGKLQETIVAVEKAILG
ncbi:guanylate kinase [Candidatus Peregrinibacteria bacterium]|nr:guanylate kinase [Candidatus Peregrinibacteria bacterium]